MLEIDKTTAINAQSIISDKQVASFSAQIDESGFAQPNAPYIHDRELYAANKTQVRKDLSEFNNYLFTLEDEAISAIPEPEGPTEPEQPEEPIFPEDPGNPLTIKNKNK